VARRVRAIPGIRLPALAAFAGALGATLVILFGLGVFEMEPVTLVVISGLALGNSLPAAVQAADMVTSWFRDNPGRIESLLALGFDRRGVTSTVASAVIRSALVPQIERTKVIGLIALPGTMTGMLLAGADPVGAVLVQLVIAYLVLGSVGVAATVVVTVMAGRAFTRDLRLADWVVRRD
jgi:putative ABC transport system permease protein